MVSLKLTGSIFLSGGALPNPTMKGRNAVRNSPTKKFRLEYLLSDAESRSDRRKYLPGVQRFVFLPSSLILLSIRFDIPWPFPSYSVSKARGPINLKPISGHLPLHFNCTMISFLDTFGPSLA
jgi:hypothetical protein